MPSGEDARSDELQAWDFIGPGEHRSAPVCLIVGSGLIGTSIAMVLDDAGWVVHLQDSNPVSIAAASAKLRSEPRLDRPQAVDLAVVAVPPGQAAEMVTQCLHEFPSATVTDVCSVKGPIMDAVPPVDNLGNFVPGHPMAGSHIQGPAGARSDLFKDRSWAIVHQSSDAALYDVLHLVSLCRATPVLVDAQTHDRAVARVSHLPHLISGALAEHLGGSPSLYRQLVGGGALDMTRIAQGDGSLWHQILNANSRALGEEVRSFMRLMERFLELIESGSGQFEEVLSGTVQSAKALHQPAPQRQVTVTIERAGQGPDALSEMLGLLRAHSLNCEGRPVSNSMAELCQLELTLTADDLHRTIMLVQGMGWALCRTAA